MSLSFLRPKPARPEPSFAVQFARNPEELTAILVLREAVFRDEQHVVESAVTDNDDRVSIHAFVAVDGAVVSAGRLTPPHWPRPEAQIAWVATLPAWRGRGAARSIVQALVETADRRHYPTILLSSQLHALPLYRSFGFKPYGERFEVRGIPHQHMERRRRPE
jgi:predicted GNAT family N-acyltransferase